MSCIVKAFHEQGWEITFSYNFKGAQIHNCNPRIHHHEVFEFAANLKNEEALKEHNERLLRAQDEYDRFVSLQDSLESALIAPESSPEYFWPLKLRRQKNTHVCYYDQSMKWAGFTGKEYMGWTGEIYNKTQDHEFVKKSLEPYKDKYIILWAMRGSMWQKAVCHIAEDICNDWLKEHPDTVIITTGDKFCQQWEWTSAVGKTICPDEGLGDGSASLVHRSGRMPFRQALLMSRYADLVVTPETGLGIGAGAYGTPKIMMLTAASIKNIVGNDKNDYSLQSEAWCSPCTRAIYNTRNCPLGPGKYITGKNIDWNHPDYQKVAQQQLPICVEFPKDVILNRMEEVYEKHGMYNLSKRNEAPDGRSVYM
jgi:hypothetical protein